MLPRAALVLLVWALACQDKGTPSTAGETGTTGTGTSSSTGIISTSSTSASSTSASSTSSSSTSSSSTSAPTTSSTSPTTGEPVPCIVERNNCPRGHVCCQFSFLDPPRCELLREGQCSDDEDCRDGFECTPGGLECPIGECVPVETSSTGTTAGSTGSSSGSSSSTG